MIRLRYATKDDVPLLRRWDEAPHVVASNPHDEWDWDVDLAIREAWQEQLIAELDGRPIGFLQILDPAVEPEHYWGDVEPHLRAIDIWIGEENDLGRGYGTEMMRQAIERCFSVAEVTAILIDPIERNVRAHRFYRRFGFRPVERRRFGSDDCLVHRLERSEWEARRAP